MVSGNFGSASVLIKVTVDMIEIDGFAGWHVVI